MAKNQPKLIARAVIGLLLYFLLTPAALFLFAGTIEWPEAWIFTILGFASAVSSRLAALVKFPDLLEERGRFTRLENVPSWDRWLVGVVALYGPFAVVIVAGLDHRFRWSPEIILPLRITAGLFIAAGYAMAVWAMVSNRFFSAVARIQEGRGHFVVDTGPYRIIRHPAYAGALAAGLALPIFLNALWAFVPTVLTCSAIVLRTYLEDQLLKHGLAGYTEYARRIRHRLVPGIW